MQTETLTDSWYPHPGGDEILDWALDAVDLEMLEEIDESLLEDEAVDEIVDTVLDAADLEILEDLDDTVPRGAGGESDTALYSAPALLLRDLLADVLWRYHERQRREAAHGGGA